MALETRRKILVESIGAGVGIARAVLDAQRICWADPSTARPASGEAPAVSGGRAYV